MTHSIPECPVEDKAKVIVFLVWKTYWIPALQSSITWKKNLTKKMMIEIEKYNVLIYFLKSIQRINKCEHSQLFSAVCLPYKIPDANVQWLVET